MSTFEIVLAIIGIAIIIISCFVVENKSSEEKSLGEYGEITDQIMFQQIQAMQGQVKKTLNEMNDQTIEQAKQQLGQISNEKIMAVSEYSNQVLEQIDKNHQEVVFLYQMLSEKEKELKEKEKELLKMEKELEKLNDLELRDITEEKIKQQELIHQEPENYKKAMEDIIAIEKNNHMQEIIELNEKGYSIVEISRQLGLGQGEVKLVIDFYHKKPKSSQ